MEPNKIPQVPQINTTPAPDSNKETFDVLHDEGIDIVQGSGFSEENEFSSSETAVDVSTPVPQPVVVPVVKEVPYTSAFVQKPVEVPAPKPAPVVPPAPTPVPAFKPTTAPVASAPVTAAVTPAEKPSLTRESINLLASLQEIPSSFIPKAPLAKPVEKPFVTAANVESVAPVADTPHPFNDPSIKHIRTFKSDAEEAVKFQNVSTMDIAIAEHKKREKTTPIDYETPKTSHTGAFIIVVMFFLVLLGGGWYYWFTTSQSITVETAPAITIKAIIPYAKASTISIDETSDPLILVGSKLLQSNAGLGNVFALVPVASTTATSPLGLESLLRNTEIPNRLLRSLGTSYMIGVYTYDTQSPFIIFKNTFFQNAFSGMLEWEQKMRTDLLPLVQVAHTGETNTGALSSAFEDIIISNVDVRVLKNDSGQPILMYAFADKDTIVVTTSQTALKYIIDRLLTVRTIQ
ncbi:MAG: hypothetical protein RLZZ67_31 [Candidatus Parcubacteria bacterium]|jgi:hypothetical protein